MKKTSGNLFSLHACFDSRLIRGLFLLVCWVGVIQVQVQAKETDIYDENLVKRSAQNNISIYIKEVPNSNFVLFKATAVFDATMDSVLAVLYDNSSYVDWLYQCKGSSLVEKINFDERYQYQVIHVPFPFVDRDVIVYSKLHQDRETGSVIISFLSASDYCVYNNTPVCKKIKSYHHVAIDKIIGSYYLESVKQGIKMTWIQHTEPGGNLPGWLVNQYVVETPYQSFLKLAEKLQEDRYKQARLVYDDNENIISLDIPGLEPGKKPEDFIVVPTF